jgi:hypothetical protein
MKPKFEIKKDSLLTIDEIGRSNPDLRLIRDPREQMEEILATHAKLKTDIAPNIGREIAREIEGRKTFDPRPIVSRETDRLMDLPGTVRENLVSGKSKQTKAVEPVQISNAPKTLERLEPLPVLSVLPAVTSAILPKTNTKFKKEKES